MKKKYAETLAREYERETKEDYFELIVESALNGQWSQVKNLFNAMHNYSKQEFLIDYLNEGYTIHRSVRNTCIKELCS